MSDMITLQEFAKQMGVTDRTMQRHLKKHQDALDGHFIRRKGNNGTLLDSFACDYISEHITEKTTILVDTPQTRALFELTQKCAELEKQIADKKLEISDLKHKHELLENSQKLLQSKNEEKDEQINALTAENTAQTAKIAEISALSAEKDKSIENLEKELKTALEDAREAHLEAQFYENLGFWGKITNKKYKKQG